MHGNAPDTVLAKGLGRSSGPKPEPQGHLPGCEGRIGQILQIIGPEVVIAPVPQHVGNPPLFEGQRIEVVLRPFTQKRSGVQAVEKRGQRPVDRRIRYAGVVPRRRHAQRIVHTRLAAPFPVQQRIRRPGAEVAVILKRLHGHLRPQRGLHLRDQHGLLGQPAVEPVFESALLRGVQIVVGPKTDRQRRPEPGRIERIVRRHRKRRAGRRLGLRLKHNPRVGLDTDPVHARIEHLTRRKTPRCRAPRKQQCREQHR